MKALEFESVSKTYSIYASPGHRLRELTSFRKPSYHQDFWALRDVSFAVDRGQVFCVIGENGAGKSTLLQLVAGILQPSAGTITTAGRVSALLELGAGFDTEFTGRDNVYLNGAIAGFSAREIAAKFSQIQDFAELGEFMNRPLKTYSSGMVVRLAFAVAIHTEPEVLLVDEALAVGDVYFKQKCMRKVHELRSKGVTILFVSHAIADVSALGDRALWLDRGRVRELGDTETVVQRYLEAMARKDAAYVESRRSVEPAEARPLTPVPIDRVPNVDHRWGDGRARVTGIALLDETGDPVLQLQPSSRLIVRIAVRALTSIQCPVVGFMLRDHLGIDFSGTDSLRENIRLPELRAGEILALDFHLDLPELHPAAFSFSPGVADAVFEPSAMCDWIDNAITVRMASGAEQVYGYTRVPCRIELNTRLSGPASALEANP